MISREFVYIRVKNTKKVFGSFVGNVNGNVTGCGGIELVTDNLLFCLVHTRNGITNLYRVCYEVII